MNGCPACAETTRIIHYWRTDMVTLKWIDDFKCLACGHRWEVLTEAIEYDEDPHVAIQ